MLIRRLAGAVAVVATCVGAQSAFGQVHPAAAAPAQSSGDWTFRFAPYGWLAFASGSETVTGQSARISSGQTETFGIGQSSFAAMAYGELRYKDRVGLFADFMYERLTSSKTVARDFSARDREVGGSVVASSSTNVTSLTVQFGIAYEVLAFGPDHRVHGIEQASPGDTALDLLFGGRWWYHRLDLTAEAYASATVQTREFSLSGSRSLVIRETHITAWVDPIVGLRVRHLLAPGHYVVLEGDVGGFGIGSRFSWEVQGAYIFEFGKAVGIHWDGIVGYRALYVDYAQNSRSFYSETNLLQHGPLLGLRMRF